DPAITVQQEGAPPPGRESRCRPGVELRRGLVPRHHHDVPIVGTVEQGRDIAEASGGAGDGAPRRFLADVIVREPLRTVTPAPAVHAREAAVMQESGDWS